jgi:hypothetical protein
MYFFVGCILNLVIQIGFRIMSTWFHLLKPHISLLRPSGFRTLYVIYESYTKHLPFPYTDCLISTTERECVYGAI